MRDAILDQAEVWVDKEGTEHRITEMSGRYCLNVYNYLKSKAQVVGFRYGLYLISLPMPPEDSAAFDDVEAAMDREQHRIGTDPRAWLLDKPLMRALLARVAVDRIERSASGYDYAADAELSTREGMTPFEVSDDFQVRPFGDLDEEVYGQRPGDETRVFMVRESDYDSADTILAVFVGNRLAAYRYEVEANRYGRWNSEVEEFDDHANGGTPGMYGQIRKYRDPWTEIRLSTVVDLVTGEVVRDEPVETVVRNDIDPEFSTSKETEGRRGHFKVRVKTSGCDAEWPQLRKLHASNVNRIRANVLDDLTKDMP